MIRSDGFLIRPVTRGDASPALESWIDDENAATMLNRRRRSWTVAEQADYFAKQEADPRRFIRGIFPTQAKSPIGLFVVKPKPQDTTFQASEAVYDYLFNTLGYAKAKANGRAENKPIFAPMRVHTKAIKFLAASPGTVINPLRDVSQSIRLISCSHRPLSYMDLLSLHFRESRLEEFKGSQDIFFSPDLKQWIVFKPELVVELLRDERLIVPNMVEAIQMLENRYKRNFPNLTFAARRIPLLLNGEVHREARRGQADMVTQGRANVTAALPELMARYVEPMDRQANPEWIASTFVPLVGDVFCLMCNCPRSLPFPRLVISRLFDRFVSLAALDAAERQIELLRQELAKTMANADPALVVPLFIIGRDTLVGTLASSLYSVLRQNLNRRFADIEFPDFPPETGVPIAERVAADSITIGPHTVAAGDRIRMYFQPMSSADGAVAKQNLFGAGAHSCLGRAISLDIWRTMTKALTRFSCLLASVSCEFEPSNIFVTPRYLQTEHHQ